LSTVARYNHVHVGVYASVHGGGTIHRGDPIRVEEG
jgi:MOSC domain-containing protein YiiM